MNLSFFSIFGIIVAISFAFFCFFRGICVYLCVFVCLYVFVWLHFFWEGLIMSNVRFFRFGFCVFFFVCIFCGLVFGAPRKGWKKKDVDIRAGSGRRIKRIHYPEGKEVFTRRERRSQKRKRRKPAPNISQYTEPLPVQETVGASSTYRGISVNVIDSPPVDGFVPWIAVSATSHRFDEADMNFYTEKMLSVSSGFLASNPSTDFAIGLFDTGASAHVMGYAASQLLNVEGAYLTDNEIRVTGVTGYVDMWISQPIGLFYAGLNAVDPGGTLDTSQLKGEKNVAIAVAQPPKPDKPDLPTALGSPMSVFFTTVIKNDNEVTINHGGADYSAPSIEIYDNNDFTNVPDYPIDVPLELKPLGAANVGYIPYDIEDLMLNIEDILLGGGLEFAPSSPSIVMGNSMQSLFFVHSVDLTENGLTASERERFMLDTGAQVTVIGSRIAARLGIDRNRPEFYVDIEGVSGEVSQVGGYTIDTLDIPAMGEWLRYTNVPVILLDISSPSGGTLDGIIGMNLFTQYNMVVRGGGMFLEDDPMLELEPIGEGPNIADVAPAGGDGVVDGGDLALFGQEWLSVTGSVCDIAPLELTDGKVNLLDFAVLAMNWLDGVQPD